MSRRPSSATQRATAVSIDLGVARRAGAPSIDRRPAARPARPASRRARRACGRARTTRGAGGGVGLGDRPADAPGAAGDERDPPVEAAAVRSPGSITGRHGSQVEAGLALAAGRRDRVDVALAQDQVLVAPDLDLVAASGANSTRSPSSTLRTVGPTATTSAHTSRRFTLAVAGIRIPARDLRSPISSDGLDQDPVGGHADRVLDVVAASPAGPMTAVEVTCRPPAARLRLHLLRGRPGYLGYIRPAAPRRPCSGARCPTSSPRPARIADASRRTARIGAGGPGVLPAHQAAGHRAAARDDGAGDDPRRPASCRRWLLIVAVLLGGALAAGGANTINCWIERDRDQLMRRTHAPAAARPGASTPTKALVFGARARGRSRSRSCGRR